MAAVVSARGVVVAVLVVLPEAVVELLVRPLLNCCLLDGRAAATRRMNKDDEHLDLTRFELAGRSKSHPTILNQMYDTGALLSDYYGIGMTKGKREPTTERNIVYMKASDVLIWEKVYNKRDLISLRLHFEAKNSLFAPFCISFLPSDCTFVCIT